MNLLLRLWARLTTLGPTEAPPAADTTETDLTPLDAEDGEEGEEAERGPATAEEVDEEEEEQEQPAQEADDDEEDDDAEDDEDDDDDLEDDDEDDDDTAESLRASWNARLSSMAAEPGARVQTDKVRLTEEARERYRALAQKGQGTDDEGKFDADAIAEIASDIAFQMVARYHQDVADPRSQRVDTTMRQIRVSRTLAAFRKEVGEALTPKVERRMAREYREFAQVHGHAKADTIPLRKLFRMAGGRMTKGKAKGKGGETAPQGRASPQKREALAAASGPRTIGKTTPGGKKPTPDKPLSEFREAVRDDAWGRLGL